MSVFCILMHHTGSLYADTAMKGSFALFVVMVSLTMTVRALAFDDVSLPLLASMPMRMIALRAAQLAATIAKIRIESSGVPAARPERPQIMGNAKSSSFVPKSWSKVISITRLRTPKDKPTFTASLASKATATTRMPIALAIVVQPA